MKKYCDQQIVESWLINAAPWIEAVEGGEIESRQLVTDRAVVDTVLSLPLKNLLDIGCGEGWLTRVLAAQGLSVLGIDAVAALLQRAAEQGGGEFRHLAYEAISPAAIADKYDAAVCNFSLIGKRSVEHVFKALPTILRQEAYLVVQTLHPLTSCGSLPYEDGWREGSWQGFSDKFSQPAPWYFRTLDTWKRLFRDNGFNLTSMQEPEHPVTGDKLSVIFVAQTS